MNIQIYPKEVLVKLIYLICFLLLLNTLGIISKFYLGYDNLYGLIPLFNFDREGNIPALYSSFALLFSSVLLTIIGIFHKRNKSSHMYWFGLAFIFLFLAFDELFSVHEKVTEPVREALHTSSLLCSAWVIPYGIGLMVFVLGYLKFLIRLPKNIMILFIVSGAIFVLGAVGFELCGGVYVETHGMNNPIFSLFYTCEEFLEMLGIVIFIYALLTYIVDQFNSLTVSVIRPPLK